MTGRRKERHKQPLWQANVGSEVVKYWGKGWVTGHPGSSAGSSDSRTRWAFSLLFSRRSNDFDAGGGSSSTRMNLS